MLVQGKRPRVLSWYHAGPMLFGDWGTSRLYVLGLAFSFTGHASVWFMGAMCLLLVAVGWRTRSSAATSRTEAGLLRSSQAVRKPRRDRRLLLCADYVVTAALSALDAFHYCHVSHPTCGRRGPFCWLESSTTSVPRKQDIGARGCTGHVAFTMVIGDWINLRDQSGSDYRSHGESRKVVVPVRRNHPGDFGSGGGRQHDRHHERAGGPHGPLVDLAGAD